MTAKISAVKQRRLDHINYLMSEIHNSTNNLYEQFIDSEYDDAKKEITNLIKRLKDVHESLEDEI